MYDGNETLSILTALADKIDCLRGSLECFVHEASVFDIPGVRPILCSCCSSCFIQLLIYQVFILFQTIFIIIILPTEVLYAPPYYL